MTPIIFSICGDPGGAAAVAPVLRHLAAECSALVRSFGYRQATEQLRTRQVATTALSETLDQAACAALLEDSNAGLLLTGTSINGVDLEKKFIAAARELGLPSFAVLDFWGNYRGRFSDKADDLTYLPDRIAIMDEQARAEMVEEGFPVERLVITGQPAFDILAAIRETTTPETRCAARVTAGVGDEETLVIFVSQPLAELCGLRPELVARLGFDESTVLPELLTALEFLSRTHNRAIHLLIRPHPRETPGKFAGMRSEQVKVTVSQDGELPAVLLGSELVFGMNSAALVEACYLGLPVLSYQPGLRPPDPVPTNRAGLSRAVFTVGELSGALADMLFDGEYRAAHLARLQTFRSDGIAASRVAQAVLQLHAHAPRITDYAHRRS